MVKGREYTIKSNSAKLQIDKWYRFWLKISLFTFSLYQYDESDPLEEITDLKEISGTHLVFEVEDHLFSKGRIGFMSIDAQTVIFDNIHLEPLNCVFLDDQDEDDDDEIIYLPPECNRFSESYRDNISVRWEVINPPFDQDLKNGLGEWNFQYNIGNREKVIYQKMTTYSEFGGGMGTALISKKEICDNGQIEVDLILLTKGGSVGVIFRYENEDDYFLLSLSESIIKLSQKIPNFMLKVESTKMMTIKADIWFTVLLRFDDSKLDLWITKENNNPIQIWDDLIISGVSKGKFGLQTFNAQGAFDNFRTMNLKDIEQVAMEQKEIEMNDEATTEVEKQQEKLIIEEFDACNAYTDLDSRSFYCNKKFGDDEFGVSNCNKNFCSVCCSFQVDENYKQKKYTCNKECTKSYKPSPRKKAWQECVQPSRLLNQSYIKFCNTRFQLEYENNLCQQSMCQLCCVYSGDIFFINSSDDDIVECYVQCGQRQNKPFEWVPKKFEKKNFLQWEDNYKSAGLDKRRR